LTYFEKVVIEVDVFLVAVSAGPAIE
jgi:hypothetical protein